MKLTKELKTENTLIGHGLDAGSVEATLIRIEGDYEKGEGFELETIEIETNKGDVIDVTALFDDWGLEKKVLDSVDWHQEYIEEEVARAEMEAESRIER